MSRKTSVTIGSSKGKKFINVYIKGKRFRFWNGSSIDVAVTANEEPELLRGAFELKVREGWIPMSKVRSIAPIYPSHSFLEVMKQKLQETKQGKYSYHQKRDCKWVLNNWIEYATSNNLIAVKPEEVTQMNIVGFIRRSNWSPRTQKNVLGTLKFLCQNSDINKTELEVKLTKVKSTLHKPIKDIPSLLNDIKQFNNSLYLCCLLTYGCLLRPHQEIRLLKWSDIDLDRGLISLSGNRNKSGRNRIVPIPEYIEAELKCRFTARDRYVLRDSLQPYSRDYIKVLWRRYKQQASYLEQGVTLYSLRHTGAIKVFEKTGSLLKLQQVMGHSDMKVSLTYLRGLEVKQLDVEDLPEL